MTYWGLRGERLRNNVTLTAGVMAGCCMKQYFLWHMAAFAAGCVLDLLVGDPHGIPHPVVGIGRLITFFEKKLFPEGSGGKRNPETELRRGVVLVLLVTALTVSVTAVVLVLSFRIHFLAGMAAETVMTCYALAARSLGDESRKVFCDLKAGDLQKARRDLAMIVGRDTENLDEAAIERAAVETVAENASDGVIAPLLYLAAGGPAAGYFYKAVNTLDSMVGYKNERYEFFGRAAARLDDAANYLPSRLSALFMIAAAAILGYDAGGALRIWRRDRRNHKSPNSAQTESACAGALHIRLGGSSRYKGVLVEKPYIGDDLRAIEIEDILRAGRLMFAAEVLAAAAAGIMIWIVSFIV